MARARNIKPAFFMNEALVELPFEARLLFIGLWTLADREGRLEDRPKRIKMELFPADELDVEGCLTMLAGADLVKRYVVDGVRVIWVRNFKRHQSPHHTEKASVLPDELGRYVGQKVVLNANKGLVVREHGEEEGGGAREGEGASTSLSISEEGGVHSQLVHGTCLQGGEEVGGEDRADLLISDCLNDECGVDDSNRKAAGVHWVAAEAERVGGGKRRSQLPKEFVLREVDVAFAQERDVAWEQELEAFKCYHWAKGSLMLDWFAAWRGWCLNSVKYAKEKGAVKGVRRRAGNGAGESVGVGKKDYSEGVRSDGTVAF